MTARKRGEPAPPVIRHAPLGELKIYTIAEHELEGLAHGSPASLFLNLALPLLSISISLMVTFATATVTSDRVFIALVCVCVITFIAGLVLLALWYRTNRNTRTMIRQIKSRMPPAEAIQEEDQHVD